MPRVAAKSYTPKKYQFQLQASTPTFAICQLVIELNPYGRPFDRNFFKCVFDGDNVGPAVYPGYRRQTHVFPEVQTHTIGRRPELLLRNRIENGEFRWRRFPAIVAFA